MYNPTLNVLSRSCPPSCNLCEEACIKCSKDGISRLTRISIPEMGVETVHMCNQCSNPDCLSICPSGALQMNESGTVVCDTGRCIGCGLCSLACQYGGIHLNAEKKKASKCDMCGGKPECAAACPYGILENIDANTLTPYLDSDIMSNGTPYCGGCLMEMLVRFTLRVLGRNIVLVGSPACCVVGGRCDVAHYGALMTNASSSLTGLTRYYKKAGRDVTCVAICGDGSTSDIAFQVLSAAAERDEKFIYICYDNEAYMNTGIQRSGTTPQGSWTTTTHVGPANRGKKQEPKNVPLLMAFHDIPYTATASLAFLEDYAQKLLKAKEASREGLAYLHVLAPCPTGWKSNPADVFKLSRLAVDTNYAPLWEARYGKFSFTHRVEHPRPISEFIREMGRFSHLSKDETDLIQRNIDKRYHLIEDLVNGLRKD